VLYIKKEKVLDKRALKGNAADNSTTDNNGPVFKEIRPVKLDFSATNFKAKVTGWRLSIEKKADTLFPTVCDTARRIAGIVAASVVSTELEHQDPQILARANLASEDEEEDEKDNIQATDIHKNSDSSIDRDHSDNNRDDNGVDDGNDSGVDEDHNNGGGEDHNNGGGDGNNSGVDHEDDDLYVSGHDNEGGRIDILPRAISSGNLNEEDEDIKGPSDDESASEVSDLTEIGFSSDVAVSCRKGVQRRRN
jgi:hypothetical protein